MKKIAKLVSLAVRSFLLDGKTPDKNAVRMAFGGIETKAVSEELVETFYPPVADGVAVVNQARIIKSNNDLIDMSIRELGLTDIHRDTFNPANLSEYNQVYNAQTLVRDVVANFLSYAHLLPASENHHHAAVGGLARHSLEVALFSLRHMASVDIRETKFTDELHGKKIRWQYAAWVIGLVHDIGKALHDMTVQADDSVWNPQLENIYDWSGRNQVSRYQVTWNYADRHGKHIGLASSMLNTVLTKAAKQYLFGTQDDLQVAIYETLSGSIEVNNSLRDSLKKGEARSVHKDMMWQWDRLTGARKMPLEAAFIKRLQMMRRGWKVNEEKADIWCLGAEDVYVSYPASFNKVMSSLKEDGFNVPMQVGKMLEMLVERQLFEPLFEDYTSGHLHPVTNPEWTAGPIKVVKPKWAGIVYGEDIPQRGIHGKISLTRDDSLLIHYADTGLITLTDTREPDPQTPANNTAAPTQPAPAPTPTPAVAPVQQNGSQTNQSKAQTKKPNKQSARASTNTPAPAPATTPSEPAPEKSQVETQVEPEQSNTRAPAPDTKGIVFKNMNDTPIVNEPAEAAVEITEPIAQEMPVEVSKEKTCIDLVIECLLTANNTLHRAKLDGEVLTLNASLFEEIDQQMRGLGFDEGAVLTDLIDNKLLVPDPKAPRKVIHVVNKQKFYQLKLTDVLAKPVGDMLTELQAKADERKARKQKNKALTTEVITESNNLPTQESSINDVIDGTMTEVAEQDLSQLTPNEVSPELSGQFDLEPSFIDDAVDSLIAEDQEQDLSSLMTDELPPLSEYAQEMSLAMPENELSWFTPEELSMLTTDTEISVPVAEVAIETTVEPVPTTASAPPPAPQISTLSQLKDATGNKSPKEKSKYPPELQVFIAWAMARAGKSGIDRLSGVIRIQSFALTTYEQEAGLAKKEATSLKRTAGDNASIATDSNQVAWMVFETVGIEHE
ncbi:MobH family relaxase [Shewanella xiamenensis]|uniref:MobH family relaxase n=1 Tax=Shewanella sp. POL2 TaxID=1201295 RepID=UPI0002F55A84|nr:MobH family relaxase [Shewanella sp. POL2]